MEHTRFRNRQEARYLAQSHHATSDCFTPQAFFAGVGAFGTVYLVKHKATGLLFALKVLNKRTIIDSGELEHILNEKGIAFTLNSSPWTVRL